MAINLPNVQPGDLISADAWNNIIAQLVAMDIRLQTLEGITPGGDGKFAISSLSATTLNVGDPLTIFGVHFGLAVQNVVTFTVNGQTTQVPQSTYDLASDDKHLKFPVPVLPSLGSTGGLVHMQVLNNNGQDVRDLTINPIVVTVPTGNMVVTLTDFKNLNPLSNKVDSPGTFLLTFNVQAFTTRQDQFDVSPSSSVGTAVFVDDNQQPITPAQATIPVTPVGGAGTNLKVLLTVPTGVATDTQGNVSLLVTAQSNRTGLHQTSGPQPFQVGEPIPALGTVGLATTGATGVTNGTLDANGVLNVTAGVECTLSLVATMPVGQAATQLFVDTNKFDGSPAQWTGRFKTPGGNPFPWQPAQGNPRPSVGVTAVAGAPDTVWRLGIYAGADTTGKPFGLLPIRVHVK